MSVNWFRLIYCTWQTTLSCHTIWFIFQSRELADYSLGPNLVMLICLHTIHGCFPVTVAEVSNCNQGCMAHKAENIYYLALYRESLPISGVKYKNEQTTVMNT